MNKYSNKITVTCKNGHTYLRSKYLVKQGCECPECKKIRLSIANKPKIMKFWDYDKNQQLDPTHLYEYMLTKSYWKCPKCGYEWVSSIKNRSSGLCPCCDVGTVIKPGYNDVLTIVPIIREDFIQSENPNIDLSKMGVAEKKTQINWTCHICGYKWHSTIFSRTRGHQNKNKINKCPVCGKAKRIKPFNLLYPELEKYYSDKNEILFNEIPGDYQREYLWECEKHGTFKQVLSAMIRAINSKYHGCPYCANKVLNSQNSLKLNYPTLHNELSFIDNYILNNSNDVSIYSTQKIWWICPNCKSKYPMSPRDRVEFFERSICSCNKCKGIIRKVTHYV